ncbi:heme-binding protein [bacterium]|nr:heme-binding protein [bacterium]
MKFVRDTLELTHEAALEMLRAGVAAAHELGQPQCIVIVDKSGETLASLRMTGAKYLSLVSARTKARTAASIGVESNQIPPEVAPLIAAATQGAVTGLSGGLPIYIDNILLGGVGIGSGSPEQDRAVAAAAIDAIGAQVSRQS